MTIEAKISDQARYFDYLVIGGGSAGCAAAAGLAQAGHSVCLMEAGGAGRGLATRMPLANAFQVPRFPGLNNWAFSTAPQAEMANRRGYQPRGKCLGGSSAINGMIYLRGRPQDYDGWEALGCAGWAWADVLPVFHSLERATDSADGPYGRDGPIHISRCQSDIGADKLFFDAAAEAGFALIDDLNGHFTEGVGPFRFTQYADVGRAGGRCTAAAFFEACPAGLRPHIETRMSVDRLLVKDGRTVGVVGYRGEKTYDYRARHEVILAAGVFGSPSILQRSGFGPPDMLRALGIDVRKPMREIGANLQDHLQCGLHYECRDRRFIGLTPGGIFDLLKAALQWSKGGQGWGSTCFTQSGGYWKTGTTLELPDVQCHFFSGIVRDHGNRLHFSRGYSG
ncbi:MAG: GMC family oxidoreductase N-terminal domain-containing protein, partial [Pseudomonadota bacterium]